jgi:hypothetical protein
VVWHRQQLALVRPRNQGVVLSLKPQHDCFEIRDASTKSLIFLDEADIVAADIPKESLGHKCFLHETLLVAQLIESSTRDV